MNAFNSKKSLVGWLIPCHVITVGIHSRQTFRFIVYQQTKPRPINHVSGTVVGDGRRIAEQRIILDVRSIAKIKYWLEITSGLLDTQR